MYLILLPALIFPRTTTLRGRLHWERDWPKVTSLAFRLKVGLEVMLWSSQDFRQSLLQPIVYSMGLHSIYSIHRIFPLKSCKGSILCIIIDLLRRTCNVLAGFKAISRFYNKLEIKRRDFSFCASFFKFFYCFSRKFFFLSFRKITKVCKTCWCTGKKQWKPYPLLKMEMSHSKYWRGRRGRRHVKKERRRSCCLSKKARPLPFSCELNGLFPFPVVNGQEPCWKHLNKRGFLPFASPVFAAALLHSSLDVDRKAHRQCKKKKASKGGAFLNAYRMNFPNSTTASPPREYSKPLLVQNDKRATLNASCV